MLLELACDRRSCGGRRRTVRVRPPICREFTAGAGGAGLLDLDAMMFSMGRMKKQASKPEASAPASVPPDLDRKQLLQLLEEHLERVQVQRREIANQLAVLDRAPARTLTAVVASEGPKPLNPDREERLELLEERLEWVQVQRREVAN